MVFSGVNIAPRISLAPTTTAATAAITIRAALALGSMGFFAVPPTGAAAMGTL